MLTKTLSDATGRERSRSGHIRQARETENTMTSRQIVCIGTVGIDEVWTPTDHQTELLGGSASYFAVAASAVGASTGLVSVVGEDFPASFRELLGRRGADLAGLVALPGNCFRWGGRYHEDMNRRDTDYTDLNVLEQFDPILPDAYRDAPYVFLANTNPVLQSKALDQMRAPRLVVLDSMNLWIDIARASLREVVARVDVLLLNEEEIRQYTGAASALTGAKQILTEGPRAVIVKRGEYGALLVHRDGLFACPALPVDDVVDPTGAGDSFAGGFVGHLALTDDLSLANFRRATAHGCVVASFTVQDFSVRRVATVTSAEFVARYRELRQLTQFEDVGIEVGH